MSDHEKDATANLEFFKSAILEPALKARSSFEYVDTDIELSTVADFGAVEAAHWAWLGVRIGYFDRKDAQELISSSQGVFEAWSNMRNREVISPNDKWADVIRLAEGEQPALSKEPFFVAEGISPGTRELLQNTFQTFLLLTAENILDDGSRYFLDSIGWTVEGKWNARREGAVRRSSGSARQIGSGFANVLNYLEEMDSSSRSAVNHDADSRFAYSEQQFGVKGKGISFSSSSNPRTVVRNFAQDARAILSRRFNLGKTEVVDRYFALAGEFASRAREDSPAWLDARLKAFEDLMRLIAYAGGKANASGHQTRRWNLFTRDVRGSLPEKEIRPQENSKKEPPKEYL